MSIFSNFPFVTSEEIDTLLSTKSLKELQGAEAIYSSKFKFYQSSRFYKDNDTHKAHLKALDDLAKGCQERIKKLEGGET